MYPYFKGGKEVRSYELFRRLPEREVQVEVYTMRWWEGGEREHSQDGMTLHGLCRARPLYAGGRRSIPQALLFALSCFKLLRAPIDVIDVDHMPYFPVLPVRLIAWLRRIPMVVTWHEWWGQAYWETYLGKVGRVAALLERLVARLGDHLVVEAGDTKARLVADGLAGDRITVLPLGVDLDAIAAAPLEEGAGLIDVSYVGRLLDHKHVDLLVSAIGRLRDEGRELVCAIVGEGPEEASLRRQVVDLHLGDHVHFLGRLEEQHEVWSVMKRSTVFAYPSTREGFGIAVLEAVACGAAVVTADHPDNYARNLIEEGVTGLSVDPSIDGLTRGIEKALELTPRKAAGADPTAVHEVPSWSDLAERLLAVYRRLLH